MREVRNNSGVELTFQAFSAYKPLVSGINCTTKVQTPVTNSHNDMFQEGPHTAVFK